MVTANILLAVWPCFRTLNPLTIRPNRAGHLADFGCVFISSIIYTAIYFK